MGDGTWNMYKAEIDAEYEKIKKQDPVAFALIQSVNLAPTEGITSGAGHKAFNELFGSAYKRLMDMGYSEAQAEQILKIGRNVAVAPAKPIDDLIAAPGVISPNQLVNGLPAAGFLSAKPGDDEAAKDVIRADLDKFIKEMMGPVSPTDPIYQQLIQGGTDAAQASAGAAGLSGRSGLAGTQAASVAQQNVAPYMAQRASLGLQAQGLRSNHELGLEGLAQGWEKINMGKADAAWAADQNAKQAAMGAIGTTLGTLGSMYGLPVTPTMGGQFGAGLASIGDKGPQYSSGPNYSTRNTYKPRKGGNGEGF